MRAGTLGRAGSLLGRLRGKTAPRARASIDRCNGRVVDGWAFDAARPNEPLTVAVLVDGKPVASGVADRPRGDLASAGFGDGRCGFSFAIEPPLGDDWPTQEGAVLTVLALPAGTGDAPLAGDARVAPREIGRRVFERGGVPIEIRIERLDLAGVHGRVIAPSGMIGVDDCVSIEADGTFAASGEVRIEEGEARFDLYLPARLFDGRVHVFTAELAGHRSVCTAVAEILPAVQTPADELLSSSTHIGYTGLAKLAAYRYEALDRRLADIAERGGDAASAAANVALAHRLLVEGHASARGCPSLRLPGTETPRVSIVIPVHDGMALTRHCLASLILAAGAQSFEVIVVDDLSRDATAELLANVEGLVIVRNEQNLGFLHSCLAGAARARGEYLVFLNNDTEVCAGWLDEMVDVLERYPDAGAVGAKLIYPDGRLQDAGGLVWENGVPWNVGHGENAWAPEYNYVRDVDYLTGAALMVTREAWQRTGGFDARYEPAYYEDTDLAFRLREAGYRTLYCPHATVVHFEGGSHGTDTERGVKRHQLINAERFVERWRSAFVGLGREGIDAGLNKDRRIAHRVLVIDDAFPCIGQDAGSFAAVQEMRLMIELGCKITFLPHNFRHVGHHVEHLQRLGIECIHAPFHTSVPVFLEQRGAEFDAVYITRYDVAERVLPSVRRHCDAPVLFNNADLHFLREMRTALAAGATDFRAPGGPLETRDREVAVMASVDAVLSYNATEREIIATHLMRNDHVFTCPWVLEPVAEPAPLAPRTGIAFLGGFGHPPNEDAVRFFAGEVMPLIVASRPETRFHVFGSRMPDGLAEELGDNCVVEGFADSLHDVFDTCRVFVAPLRAGAGIKGKVLDSVAHGVPAVLSPVAAESTGLEHGLSTFIASDPEAWAARTLELLENDALWHRMSAASHALAGERYGFEAGLARMREVFQHVGLTVGGGGFSATKAAAPGGWQEAA